MVMLIALRMAVCSLLIGLVVGGVWLVGVVGGDGLGLVMISPLLSVVGVMLYGCCLLLFCMCVG